MGAGTTWEWLGWCEPTRAAGEAASAGDQQADTGQKCRRQNRPVHQGAGTGKGLVANVKNGNRGGGLDGCCAGGLGGTHRNNSFPETGGGRPVNPAEAR